MSVDVWAVQQAVVTALTAAFPSGPVVKDHVPDNTSQPYIKVGEGIDLEDDNSLSDGIQHELTIHAFSSYRGTKEIKQTAKTIRDTLHHSNLTVAGLASCHCFIDTVNYFDEPDGVRRHAVIRARFMCRT